MAKSSKAASVASSRVTLWQRLSRVPRLVRILIAATVGLFTTLALMILIGFGVQVTSLVQQDMTIYLDYIYELTPAQARWLVLVTCGAGLGAYVLGYLFYVGERGELPAVNRGFKLYWIISLLVVSFCLAVLLYGYSRRVDLYNVAPEVLFTPTPAVTP